LDDHEHIKADEFSRSLNVEALGNFLFYGRTPSPPICILVLRPFSSWLKRALHTMGMEGGLDQRSGNPPPALILPTFFKRGYIEDAGQHDVRQTIYSQWYEPMVQHFGCNRGGRAGLIMTAKRLTKVRR
jgi:hypothetical protein